MNETEFLNYTEIYNEKAKQVASPMVFIYLRTATPVLMKRIQKRGRDYEQSIKEDYLDRLGGFYDLFFESFSKHFPNSKVITCETSGMDVDGVYESVIRQIDQQLRVFELGDELTQECN
jgi:deoxyadenosine/deoxycytidine kinase